MNTNERIGIQDPQPTTEGELRDARARVVQVVRASYVERLEDFVLRSHHPARLCASALRADELQGARCFLTPDGLSGFAIQPDGMLVGLFSFVRGRGARLVRQAVLRGARCLECYAKSELVGLYESNGFRIVECHAFDADLAPLGWEQGPLRFCPDYVRMERPMQPQPIQGVQP